jgi:hypothetical protein
VLRVFKDLGIAESGELALDYAVAAHFTRLLNRAYPAATQSWAVRIVDK